MNRAGKGDRPSSGGTSVWHICWQAAVGRDFFPHPRLYQMVRTRLIDAHHRRGRDLIDFALLPGEMHALSAAPKGGCPSDIARAVGPMVTRWVGQAQGVRSPVLAGPFRARRLHAVVDLRNDVRMLAWRPVRLGLCEQPSEFLHGSHRVLRSKSASDRFDVMPLLQSFGSTVDMARTEWHAHLARSPSHQEWHEWELTRGLVLATGSVGPRFACAHEVQTTQAAALISASATRDLDGALRLLAAWVSRRVGADGPADLFGSSRSDATRGRALVARIASKHALCSAAAVARFFGKSKATLSEQITASRSNRGDTQVVDVLISRVISEATRWPSSAPAVKERPVLRGQMLPFSQSSSGLCCRLENERPGE